MASCRANTFLWKAKEKLSSALNTLKLYNWELVWISSEEKSKRGPTASFGKACFVLFTVGPKVGSGCHLSKWWLENLDKWWPISRDTASEHPANQLWLAGPFEKRYLWHSRRLVVSACPLQCPLQPSLGLAADAHRSWVASVAVS